LENENGELSKQQAEMQIIQRNIKDNIQLKKYQAEMIVLDQKSNLLRQQISLQDQRTMESDYDALKTEHESMVGEVIYPFNERGPICWVS
jgi:hypothetical protein